jgi:hypothetical protein
MTIIVRRYERFSTLPTSNRPVEGWGRLSGDVAVASAMQISSSTMGTCSSAAAELAKPSFTVRALPLRSRDLALSARMASKGGCAALHSRR